MSAADQARAILIARIEQLSNLACDVDGLRADFKTVPEWHAALTQAVDLLHGVAMEADEIYGLGLYDDDEGDAT